MITPNQKEGWAKSDSLSSARKDEPIISLICVFNDLNLVESLRASAAKQTMTHEMILLDNRGGQYGSAVQAYREGMKRARGKWLVFLHQDIEFQDETYLSRIAEIMKETPRALYGVAGVKSNIRDAKLVSTLLQGNPPNHRFKYMPHSIEEAFVLDECLFFCERELFNEISFDSEVCWGWDFYAVDLSLQAHRKGIPVYVVESEVWHKSPGHVKRSYLRNQRDIAKKYKGEYRSIRTCVTWFPTGSLLYWPYRFCRVVRGKIRNVFGMADS